MDSALSYPSANQLRTAVFIRKYLWFQSQRNPVSLEETKAVATPVTIPKSRETVYEQHFWYIDTLQKHL